MEAKPAPPRVDWWQRGTAAGGLISVLLVAVGLYLTNQYNRAQQDLAVKGQRADRFVTAVDQLGQEGNRRPGTDVDDKLGIRLGGIYALEALMRDSPDDENAVIEVLAAFIRTHAPRPKSIPKQVPVSPVDIRAALSVLSRRPNPQVHIYLDIANTLLGLNNIDLRDWNLDYAYLSGADLTNAGLNNAHLTRADLSGANLTGADLTGADLSGANLTGADLTGAVLSGANLTGADVSGADLTDAELNGTDLSCTTMDDLTKLPPRVARSDPGTLESPRCKSA